MKSRFVCEITDIFKHFGGTEAPAGLRYKKRAEESSPASENATKTLPVSVTCWEYVGVSFLMFIRTPSRRSLFLIWVPKWLQFRAKNMVKSDKNTVFLGKCRHAFGSSRLDRIACRASPDRSHNPEKACYKSDAILKLSFYPKRCPK